MENKISDYKASLAWILYHPYNEKLWTSKPIAAARESPCILTAELAFNKIDVTHCCPLIHDITIAITTDRILFHLKQFFNKT